MSNGTILQSQPLTFESGTINYELLESIIKIILELIPIDIYKDLKNLESISGVNMTGEYEEKDDQPMSFDEDMEIKTSVFFRMILCSYEKKLLSITIEKYSLLEILTKLAEYTEVRILLYRSMCTHLLTLVAKA
ncbi:MAG: hypothetical protein ABIM99_06615 [Candidatus Dojkabacteria bacterium]